MLLIYLYGKLVSKGFTLFCSFVDVVWVFLLFVFNASMVCVYIFYYVRFNSQTNVHVFAVNIYADHVIM